MSNKGKEYLTKTLRMVQSKNWPGPISKKIKKKSCNKISALFKDF